MGFVFVALGTIYHFGHSSGRHRQHHSSPTQAQQNPKPRLHQLTTASHSLTAINNTMNHPYPHHNGTASMHTSPSNSVSPPSMSPKPSASGAAPNAFVRVVRKIYHPLGFKKGYNFFLFFNFAGALVGFCLARLQFLNVDGIFCGPGFSTTNRALPGECYWYRSGHERVGIILHLATVLPAGLLLWLQFIPAIRYKWILFHRINGYFLLLLSLLVTISGLMITRHAFGGGLAVQVSTAVTGFAFTGGLIMAYVNIKRLQIEQHRAWMLRAWFWVRHSVLPRCRAMDTR